MSEVIETPVEDAPSTKPESISDLKRKMKLNGIVTRLELYGAFIDVGVGVNALIHISQIGNDHVNRVADVLSEGQEVTVWVDKVDPKRDQLMVTMIEPLAVEWRDLKKGQAYTGTVTRVENFGAFVNIGAEREGLIHISELSHDYIKHPSETVSVGDEVQVEVLGFSKRKRRIDLSIKSLLQKPEAEEAIIERIDEVDFDDEEEEEALSAMAFALQQALGDDMPRRSANARRKKKSGRKRGRRHQKSMQQQQDELLDRTLHVPQ